MFNIRSGMARPWRILYAGAKYHVTVRGNARQEVFHEERDYLRFIEQLSDGLEKDEIILYAFVLMSNHYHLFVETKHGNIQRFMQRLNTAYSMYHRYKHNQPGHCFQGRYGAKLVKGDDYILRLTRYVHLNPVNPLFPALRSGHRLFQRPSPEKQFPSSQRPSPEKQFPSSTPSRTHFGHKPPGASSGMMEAHLGQVGRLDCFMSPSY